LISGWAALGIIWAAVQHDVLVSAGGGDFSRDEAEPAFWHPRRLRFLAVAFIVVMGIFALRLIALAVDNETTLRYYQYIEETAPKDDSEDSLLDHLFIPRLRPPLPSHPIDEAIV